MKWVTWENIGVDRMGSGWLIQRFIDPQAEFRFIPFGQAPQPEQGEPFDIPGVRFSHHDGHSTFHTLVREHGLTDQLLDRIANMIDEADAAQVVALEPTAAGLDFICRGLRRTSPDDETAMERGKLIYEAVYAQLNAETPN